MWPAIMAETRQDVHERVSARKMSQPAARIVGTKETVFRFGGAGGAGVHTGDKTMATTTSDGLARVPGRAPSGTIQTMLEQNWWVLALRGALAVVFGAVALFLPGLALLSFVLLFSAFCLVDGAFAIAGAIMA